MGHVSLQLHPLAYVAHQCVVRCPFTQNASLLTVFVEVDPDDAFRIACFGVNV